MKKINKLITILFIFAIVSFFSFAKWDECDDLYNEYNNCLSNCRHDCMISNPIDPGSCISQCTWNCNTELNTYKNCVSNWEWEWDEWECEWEDECWVWGEEWGEEWENERRENPEVQWYADCTNNIDVNTENLNYINQLADGTCCFDWWWFEPQCPCDVVNEEEMNNCNNQTWMIRKNCRCVCDSSDKCCWIKLNTVVPFIWDCIELNTDSHRWDTTAVTSITAFPLLMQWLMKILMSAIMVFSFLMVIIAWLMMTTWAFSNSSFSKWKNILKNVIISLILLWCSWLILSLINPSFFGG